MRRLFSAAFGHRSNRLLVLFTLFAMCLATFGSQMEALSLAIVTNKGPTAFELFSDGNTITKAELETRWQELDPKGKGYITPTSVNRYLTKNERGNFVQRIIQKIDTVFPLSRNLWNLAFFLIFVAIFKAITLFTHRYCTRLVAIRVSRDLRQKYFGHIQTLPMSFYHQYNIGSLSSRVVGDAYLISEAVNSCMINYFQAPFTIISTLTLCFLTSWQLSIIVFCGLPLILGSIVFLARRVKRIAKQIQRNQETFTSVLIDFLSGIQTVKLFSLEKFSMRKFDEQNERLANLEKRSAKYDLASRPIVHTIGIFFLATTLICGLYILNMGVPDVLFYAALLYTFYEPIKKFAEENAHIQRGIAASERLHEVLDIKPQIVDQKHSTPFKTFDQQIQFKDVWFRYNQEWVLKGLNFSAAKGETVAIVGPTGSGKSTIVQLIPRLYDVEKGEITIDGKSLKAYTTASLRDNIAFVPQKPFLFLDTVAENISFGRPYPEGKIEQAAKRAHADEFICKLPKGYQTELLETGKNLSGGQQQRLAIARALVKDAPILIMDEATSSLDNVSEQHIKSAIQQLRGEVTQIIIAHRLSTIEGADKIIYLEDGKKIAEGTKEELLKKCSGFKAMWEARSHEKA